MWSAWTACSATCDGGLRSHQRRCMGGDVGEEGCVGPVFEEQFCNGEVFLVRKLGDFCLLVIHKFIANV